MGNCKVRVFAESSFVAGTLTLTWGWHCFTCGEEETGFGNATTAAEAGEQHGMVF